MENFGKNVMVFGLNSNVTSDYTLPASSTDGFADNNAANVYNASTTTCDGTNPCRSYYTYAAATAGTNPSAGADSTSDICSKNWRLPTKQEIEGIKTSYSSSLAAAPFRAEKSGSYNNSTFDSSVSYFLSSTSSTAPPYHSFKLSYISNTSSTGITSSPKYIGSAVHCVLK